MLTYLISRLIQAVFVLVVMSFAIYGLIGLMPGDPIDLMIQSNPDLTTEDAARLKTLYGLDRPITERYWNWLGSAVTGDFGYSRLHAKPVLEVLWPRLSLSAVLMGLAFILALIIALPAGITAAVRRGSFLDRALNLFCFAGVSVPSFWFALLLIMFFAVYLGLLPAGGLADSGDSGFFANARYLVLPVLALSITSIAGYSRHLRASMIQCLREDYVRTARAKGQYESRIVWHHALRNALLPVITIMALDFGALFSGAMITETMFSIPGMGKMIYDSILGNDYNLALVGLLFATAVTLLANLAADLIYAWLDPRISYRAEAAR